MNSKWQSLMTIMTIPNNHYDNTEIEILYISTETVIVLITKHNEKAV